MLPTGADVRSLRGAWSPSRRQPHQGRVALRPQWRARQPGDRRRRHPHVLGRHRLAGHRRRHSDRDPEPRCGQGRVAGCAPRGRADAL